MGKRGPPKKPTAMKEASGSWRANENPDEPRPPKGAPIPPVWMDAREREVWGQICAILTGMRVMTIADGQAVGRYCQVYVEWMDAVAFIKENGTVYPMTNRDGKVLSFAQFPQVTRKDKLSEQLLRLEKEYGLTASSRAGIQVTALPEGDTDKNKFFLKIDKREPAKKQA